MIDNVIPFSYEKKTSLHLNLSGFEGPLDLLLSLARENKIDMSAISMTDLASQYIDFIERVKMLKISVAMEYLIMASWLAWLKSRLLLPQLHIDEEEDNPLDAARLLAWRLKKMDAIKTVAQKLIHAQSLYKNIFPQSTQEFIEVQFVNANITLTDLLKAYKNRKDVKKKEKLIIKKRQYVDFQLAFSFMKNTLENTSQWISIDKVAKQLNTKNDMKNSSKATLFATTLLMAHEGRLNIKQDKHFDPLYVKASQ